jgi:hypothetical protein
VLVLGIGGRAGPTRWLGGQRPPGHPVTVAVQVGFVVGAVGSAATNLADRFPAHRVMGASTSARR